MIIPYLEWLETASIKVTASDWIGGLQAVASRTERSGGKGISSPLPTVWSGPLPLLGRGKHGGSGTASSGSG